MNALIDSSEEGLSEEEIKEIEKGLEDVKKNRTQSIESVADEMGIKLE